MAIVHVKTDDLEGGYYPIAGADVFLLNMSARTNENGYATFTCTIPDIGASASVHRIGYKPEFAYFSATSTEDVEMSTTFEIASVKRITEIFTDFQTSLVGTGNTLNWENMIDTVTDYQDYVLIDPTTRSHLIIGSDCSNLLSDFCSKRNGTYQETASSSADTNNTIQSWYCRGASASTTLSFMGHYPELHASGYSATNISDIGQFQSIGNDFIIGLPCFYYNIYDASTIGTEYYFIVSGTSGQAFESEHGTILDSDENNIYHRINEMRITGTTAGTTLKTYFVQNPSAGIWDDSPGFPRPPYSQLVITREYLYLFNTPTDYWSCYDNQFSTDGYNHYNGPFGPTFR